MSVLKRVAEANAGLTALGAARTARATEMSAEAVSILHQQEMIRLDTLIEQNNRIIELLAENFRYLAAQKQ